MQTQDAAPGPHTEASSATTLHGRRKELDHIDDLLRAARESHSAVLVVRGPAGIGKTALLDEARARAGGMQVLVCRGTELEKRLPFAALHQLLRPVLDRIDAIPTIQAQAPRCALGLEGGSQRPERFLVSLATLNVLAEAAERAPLLCVVDDAHWLDDASADILVFVARRLDAEPIAMVLAARDEEHARARAPELPQLTLAGLDDDASHAVIEGRALAPDVAAWLVGATDGNPLALLELSAGLTDAQAAGVEPILGPLPISSALERAFLTRVRRLPPATQELLLVAATDESGDLTTILDAAAGLGIAAEALDDAERAGLIRARGMRLELRHPLVRSAIYHGAPHSQRRAAHRALAAVLVGESRADRRAWHRAAASTEPDPAVVASSRRRRAAPTPAAATTPRRSRSSGPPRSPPTSTSARAYSPPRPRTRGCRGSATAPWRCCAGCARRAPRRRCAPTPTASSV
jgi:predicted ATPase